MNSPAEAKTIAAAKRGYPDLHEHLKELKHRGLLLTIDRPIDKDAELHPLVRWQFVGSMEKAARFIREEIARWMPIVKAAVFKIE